MIDPAKLQGAFAAARTRAERLAKDHKALGLLLGAASEKAKTQGSKLEQALNDLLNLMRLVKAYISGDYRKIPWTSLVTAIAGIVYFVMPVDLIPDWIPLVGYIDDAAVIAFCIHFIRKDLADFLTWEHDHLTEDDTSD